MVYVRLMQVAITREGLSLSPMLTKVTVDLHLVAVVSEMVQELRVGELE